MSSVVECSVCQRTFPSPERLAYHHRITHKANLFECAVLKNYELLEGEGPPRAKCLLCKTVLLPRHLNEHLKRHFESFTCDDCGQVFQAKKDLKSHKEQHLAVQVVCPECGLAFNSSVVYRSHKIRKHGGNKANGTERPSDPPVSCDLCGKVVKKSSLKKHLKHVHSEPTSKAAAKPVGVVKRQPKPILKTPKEEPTKVGTQEENSPNGRKTRGTKVTLKSASLMLCSYEGSKAVADGGEMESKPTGGGNARRKSKSIPRKSVNIAGHLQISHDCDSGEDENLDELDVSQYFTQPSTSTTTTVVLPANQQFTEKKIAGETVELHNLSPVRHPPITELTCLTRVSTDYLTPLEGIPYPMVDNYFPNFNEPLPEPVWQDSDSHLLDGSKNFPVWTAGQHGSIGAALTQAIDLLEDKYGAVLPL